MDKRGALETTTGHPQQHVGKTCRRKVVDKLMAVPPWRAGEKFGLSLILLNHDRLTMKI
jgi:hypothetical protein